MTDEKKEALTSKLYQLAELAEEISVLCFEESKETSRKFSSIGKYTRRILTCVRMYGEIPQEKQNKIRLAIDSVTNVVKGIEKASRIAR